MILFKIGNLVSKKDKNNNQGILMIIVYEYQELIRFDQGNRPVGPVLKRLPKLVFLFVSRSLFIPYF